MPTRAVSHQIRRSRTERRLRQRALLLGFLLSVLTVALLFSGKLQTFQNLLYDLRVRWCQFFRTPPTSRLVHVDIDDDALETVGRWPWPRAILGDVVDELKRSGVKAIAFDVVMSEPQMPVREADGQITDNDAMFAAAIRRAGNVLTPVSMIFEPPMHDSPAVMTAQVELTKDLELPMEKLKGTPTQDEFVHALRNAMRARVRQEIAATPGISFDAIRARLLPTWARSRLDANAPVVKILSEEYQEALSNRAIESFTIRMPNDIVALHSYGAIAALPAFLSAARYCSMVDHIPESDGSLRRLPLVAEFRGRLVPHMGLVLACAALDVDPQNLQISADQVVIPAADGNNITIPVSNEYTPYGTRGMFMNVPWFGNGVWTKMYPGADGGHLNIGVLTELADWRRRLVKNNAVIDKAILDLLRIENNWGRPERYQRLKLSPDDLSARLPYIEQFLKNDDIKFSIDQLRQVPADQRAQDADPESYDILSVLREQNGELSELIKTRSVKFHSLLNNAVVLVGETASSTTDLINTPLAKSVPGVVAHGVVVNGILTRQLWKEAPRWVAVLHTLAAGLLATIAVAFLKHWKAFIVVLVTLLVYLFVNGLLLFDRNNYLVDPTGPITAMILVYVAVVVISRAVEAAEHARITHHFRTYVDPQLVDYHLENPEYLHIKGEVKELSVVFTDLVGFTAITERMREQTVEILNEYLTIMVPIIRNRRGLVNKFLGDGIMIIFGALWENPGHAKDAVDTVLEMLKATAKFSEELQSRGLPPVQMRAGISTGPMVVGDAGSRTARDYTVLGDLVNTAARLEQANKRLDTRVLITGGTQAKLDARFLTRPVGNLMLAGKTEPVETYEVLAHADEATAAHWRLAHLSTTLMTHVSSQKHSSALETIESITAEFGATKFTHAYKNLCDASSPTNHISA